MHIAHATLGEGDPHVEVSEPWRTTSGQVVAPGLNVWPLGQRNLDAHWSLSLEEAQALAAALLEGVRQAHELFGA